MRLRHGQAVALMALVTVLWATAGAVTRQLDRALPFEVTFWRSAFTCAALLVFLVVTRGRDAWASLRGQGWPVWVSGLCWSIMFTAFMVALTLTNTANVLVTSAVGPLMTALISRALIGHRLPMRTWVSIAVAGLGIAWMYGRQVAHGHWLGSSVAFLVPLSAAFNWTLVQRSQRQGYAEVDPVPAVLLGGMLSALFTLPLAWPLSTSVHDVAWLAGLGVGQLAIPCVLAVFCARVLSAPEMSLLSLLEVIFGISMAWWWAAEQPPVDVLQGGALVLLALVGNEWLGRRKPSGG